MHNYIFGANILPIDLGYKNILRLNDELHALDIPHEFVRHLDGLLHILIVVVIVMYKSINILMAMKMI